MLLATVALMVASGCKKDNPDPNSVTDCQGYTYPIVKIGNQTWMAENLRCTKYDTESDLPGAVLSETPNENCNPYCFKAYIRANWYEGDGLDKESNSFVTGKNLSDEQVSKLGCVYNWAAAVGFKSGAEALAQVKEFDKPRQGICPNGWHLPTIAEWDELAKTLGGVYEKVYMLYPEIGKKLKSTSGWYKDEKGSDTNGFNVLPAGGTYDGYVAQVGLAAFFCTASPADYKDDRYTLTLNNWSDDLHRYDCTPKLSDASIRCVKN